ncbi:MAG: heme ABC transporter permease CcmC [Rickettsiaceae bacterium]|nr:heme ABC transporter permease CcmC [Rickettsiaceae bacterium]
MLWKLLNPYFFTKYSTYLQKYILSSLIFCFAAGLYFAFTSPEDYQQSIMVRVMYIHVPSAWLSLMIFVIIGMCAISCLIWKTNFTFYIALASAPIGATFALITLLTGMIWGKPIWGTWWVWDARLTSMLILFIFYIIFILISSSNRNIHKIQKPSCVIAILGMINVPIVKFSVDLWSSLHQSASILNFNGPQIHGSMLAPLFIMFVANCLLYIFLLLQKVESLLYKYKTTNHN